MCQGIHVEVRGQLARVSYLLYYVSFKRSLGFQAWWQVSLPVEPPHCPLTVQFLSCFVRYGGGGAVILEYFWLKGDLRLISIKMHALVMKQNDSIG